MAKANDSTEKPADMPSRPVERLLSPIRRYLHVESASGIALMACTIIALVLANSPFAETYKAIWKTKIELNIGTFSIVGDLGHLVINDGLMAIFFFVIGLEIKREIVLGELREFRKALMPVVAAIGGMVVPAGVYLALQWGQPGQRGWAIPMATDIAFVVGLMALFGSRVPFSLKILMLSLAIVDDLGAVLVIATVYSENLALTWLGVAAGGFVLTYALNKIGVRSVNAYIVVGIGIWYAVYKSGVHPTVAGVMLGLMTPSSAWVGNKSFFSVVGELWDRLREYDDVRAEQRYSDLKKLQFAAKEAVSPLQRLETSLHPWVAYGIMPLFALANAGVTLEVSKITEPISMSVAAGLALGKPLGIMLFCWLAVQLGITSLPQGVNWKLLFGGACLAGIGFTMSLFINGLSFPAATFPGKEGAGKIGTLLGSTISIILGTIVFLFLVSPRKIAQQESRSG